MDNYLDLLPKELFNIIIYDLTYNEILILENEYQFVADYQWIIQNKYPAYYEILRTVKKDNRYKSYSYEQAFNLIDNVDTIVKLNKFSNSFIEGIKDINDFKLYIYRGTFRYDIVGKEIRDLIVLYDMIITNNSEFFKYRPFFPKYIGSDYLIEHGLNIYSQAWYYDMNRAVYKYNSDDHDSEDSRRDILYYIFVIVLKNEHINNEDLELLNMLNNNDNDVDKIIIKHMINYVTNKLLN